MGMTFDTDVRNFVLTHILGYY